MATPLDLSDEEFALSTGKLMIEEGVLTLDEIRAQVAAAGAHAHPIALLLLESAHRSQEELARFLGEAYQVPEIALTNLDIPAEIAALVPAELASKHEFIPVARFGDLLCVARANYHNRAGVSELRRHTGLKIKILRASEEEVAAAILRTYQINIRILELHLDTEAPTPRQEPTRPPAATRLQPAALDSLDLEDLSPATKRPTSAKPAPAKPGQASQPAPTSSTPARHPQPVPAPVAASPPPRSQEPVPASPILEEDVKISLRAYQVNLDQEWARTFLEDEVLVAVKLSK